MRAPIVVCNNDHRFLVREELARAGLEPQAVMLEPIARNTAAAVAAAALFAVRQDADAILLVMPSDHVIADTVGFLEDVRQAAQIAATGRLVLFGVKADEPHTGYGYIRQGAALNGANGGFAVDEFREKPDRAKAEGYLAAGGYFWNSGIFVLSARAYLAELERLDPAIYKAARGALQDATQDMDFLRLDQTAFAASPNISIDYAVMEKTKAAAMLPLDVGWSDVGSWSSLWEISPHDEYGNAVEGDAVLIDTSNSLLRSERSLVAAIGVDNLVIVDTPDALLVADKSRSQEVSAIVAKLKQSNRKEHEQHLRNYRPWGYFETLSIGGALPGQAPARRARRQALHADASPPLRALGRGARHRARDGGRQRQARAGERERLHHGDALAPAGKSGEGAAGDHRGAARLLPR